MREEYLYYQAITQFKIKLDEEGKPVGRPIYVKGWTSPINESYKTKKAVKQKAAEEKKAVQKDLSTTEQSEVIEL